MGWGWGWTGDCGCCDGPCDTGQATDDFTGVSDKWKYDIVGNSDMVVDTAKPGARFDIFGGSSSACRTGIARCVGTPSDHWIFELKMDVLVDHAVIAARSTLFHSFRLALDMQTDSETFNFISPNIGFNAAYNFSTSQFDSYEVVEGPFTFSTSVTPTSGDELSMIIEGERTSGDTFNLDIEYFINSSSVRTNPSYVISFPNRLIGVVQRLIGDSQGFGNVGEFQCWSQNYYADIEAVPP